MNQIEADEENSPTKTKVSTNANIQTLRAIRNSKFCKDDVPQLTKPLEKKKKDKNQKKSKKKSSAFAPAENLEATGV